MSGVIARYNQARFLGEAIESALAQGYPDFEIVVVDDGSTDDTSEVTGRYPGVRLVRQDNRGPPRRATRGWARAGGVRGVPERRRPAAARGAGGGGGVPRVSPAARLRLLQGDLH